MALTGRTAALMLLGVLPVLIAPGWASLLGWTAVVVAVVGLDLALAVSPRALTVSREETGSVRLGRPVSSAALITNTSARDAHTTLRDAWQPSAGAARTHTRMDVPAGQRRRLNTELVPERRGDLVSVGIAVRSFGPLRLAARQRTVGVPGRLRVLHPFGSRRHLPSRLARLRELDGRAAVQVRGQGTEFDSLRDYVIGDDVRAIDWRATARGQQVVVRTWRPERERRVLIVLDTSRTSAARVGGLPRLDSSMDAALLLGALASRAGDRVGLLAMDRRVRGRVDSASRASLLADMVDATATLQADLVEADWTTIVGAIRATLSRRALVVLLTSLEPAALDEGLLPVLPMLTSRHLVMIGAVDDPHLAEMAGRRRDVHEVYEAAAAERAAIERTALVAELTRYGVEVVSGRPEELPPRLADRYLALKAAGRL